MKWNKLYLLACLTLTACSTGGTESGKPADCEKLRQECRFNNNADGCLAVKQKPEEAERTAIIFALFCQAES